MLQPVHSVTNIEHELESERLFAFNKNHTSEELLSVLQEIEQNKRKWKALYMAVWGLPLYVLDPWINNGDGDKVMKFNLPAAKYRFVHYTPKELKNYLINYDNDILISQLIKIFTMLENYFFIYNKEIGMEKIDFTKFESLKKYIEDNNFANEDELAELELAKETRNCFVHRRGVIDKKWMDAHNKTQRKNIHHIGEKIPTPFNDIENWTDILVKIIDKSITARDPSNLL